MMWGPPFIGGIKWLVGKKGNWGSSYYVIGASKSLSSLKNLNSHLDFRQGKIGPKLKNGATISFHSWGAIVLETDPWLLKQSTCKCNSNAFANHGGASIFRFW